MRKKPNRKMVNWFEGNFKGLFIFNAIMSMFGYDGWEIPNREIERLLCKLGVCGVVRLDGKLIAVEVTRGGELDVYGDGDLMLWTTGDGRSGESKIGEDCVIIYNNSMRFSDMPIIDYIVNKIQQADITENSTLVLARLMPIFAVSDENGKKRIDAILDNVMNGELKSVVSKDILDEIATQGKGKSIEVLNVTDLANVDKLQFVVKFYDDVIRRLCNLYGLPMDSSGKMAQLNIKETQGQEALAQIYPLDRLRCRRMAMDDVKRVFGVDVKVRFTEVWAHCERVMLDSNVEEIEDRQEGDSDDNLSDSNDIKVSPEENKEENTEENKEDKEDDENE